MDPTSYAAPARVKSLVVPVGTLKINQFDQYYARLCQASDIPLIDVRLPREAPDHAREFDPRANPTGSIMFDFETAPMPQYQQPLLDLEPWRQQMLIVGIAHYSATSPEGNAKMIAQLRKQYDSGICHVILVFGVPGGADMEQRTPGVYPILKSNITSLESTLSTVSGDFFFHLSLFWKTRQLNSFQSPSALVSSTANSAAKPTRNGTHSHRYTPSAVTIGRNGSISMGSTERAKSRQEGRTLKFLGTLYLMSGLMPDALAALGTAATVLKDQGDHLWYGSALSEIGVCLVYLRYHSIPSGAPSVAVSAAWSVALKQLKRKKSLSRSSQVPVPSAAPPVQSSDHPLSSRSGSADHSASQSFSSDADASPRSSISINRTMSLHKTKPFTDQTPVDELLEFLTQAVLDEYALGRGSELVSHTVYYETIARYVNLLICLRNGWSREALSAALANAGDGSRALDLKERPLNSNSSTIEKWISKVYELSLNDLGPDTHARILGTVARLYSKSGFQRKWAFACAQIVSLLASSSATVDADLGHLEDILAVYSKWPKLEASLLRKLVALGQRIQSPRLQADAATHLLSMVCHGEAGLLMDREQMTMYHLVRSYGDVVQSTFWDPKVIVDCTVKAHRLTTVRTNSRKPSVVQQTMADATAANSSRPTSDESGIIYNPFEGTESKEEGSIERGVPTVGRIFLRNPLAVEIQVFELALVNFQGKYVSEVVKDVVIPANTTSLKVEATVFPGDDPEFQVSGCHVQVSGCLSQVISLPAPICIPVIPPRPVLVLQSISLLKGWTMLLEGERQRFSIVLWNSSFTSATEALHFGFNDSTVDPLRQAVAKQDTSRAEFYEYEFFLHKRRAIDLVSEPDQSIAPRSSRTFEFDLYGKRGVNAAAVLVDYGVNEDCLRRLKIPLQLTVCPSVSLDRVNILPTNSNSFVYLVLDMHNSWREQLECTIWADGEDSLTEISDGSNGGTSNGGISNGGTSNGGTSNGGISNGGISNKLTLPIDAGTTRRFLISVPWSPMSLEELQQPIPSFSKRQFTVDTRTSADQLQLFWLRERLLNKLHGEWSTGDRRGSVELRAIQLSHRMASVLKTSVVEVTAASALMGAELDTPCSLKVTVFNKSANPVQGMLRLVPNRPAQRYMLVIGSSQTLVTVPGGGQVDAEFHMVFLSHGSFELTSVLDPIASDSTTASVYQTSKTTVHI